MVENQSKDHMKIAFFGTPGTGKSSVAQAVQVEMGSHECITAVCPEYAREFITKNGQPEHIAMQQGILFKQMHREDTLSHGCDMLFCDSPVFFCYSYALMAAEPNSKQQAKILRNLYKWAVLDNLHRYDMIFYLPRQFEVVDDKVRDPSATEFVERSLVGFVDQHKHLFKHFEEVISEEQDPKEILKDRVRQVKRSIHAEVKKKSNP